MNLQAITQRRHDLDWLRVLAFMTLIFFHSAIAYIPGGIPMIQNGETSQVMGWMVDFLHQFRLALLFFISGVGVAFARRRRNSAAFIKERSARLLIPLVFGILIIVPPMVYTEKLFTGEFNGSFRHFYPLFFTEGVYPVGNLSWHHFWFIAYLYLYCLLALPLFNYIETPHGQVRLSRLILLAQRRNLYLFIIPLAAVEISLRAFFPGFRDLIHDWASFFHWFLIFLAGHIFAQSENLLGQACSKRQLSLAAGMACTLILFVFFHDKNGGFTPGPREEVSLVEYILFCVIRMANVWCWLLTCLGYAGRYLRFNNPLLTYINHAVYPLFILHLTIIVILGYFLVPMDMNLWIKYLLTSFGTVFLVFLIFHFMIRPLRLMRLLFGLKSEQKTGYVERPKQTSRIAT